MKTLSQWLFAVLAILPAAAAVAAPAQHAEQQGQSSPASPVPMTRAVLDARLEDTATQIVSHFPSGVSPSISPDFAFPRDDAEYAAVGGNALVMLIALTRDPAQLPLKSVYARTAHGDVKLRRIASWQDRVPEGSATRAAFGGYRQYAIYLWPLAAIGAGADLVCDFAVKDFGFKIAVDPASGARRYTAQAGQASASAIRAFVARQYPDLVPGNAWDAP